MSLLCPELVWPLLFMAPTGTSCASSKGRLLVANLVVSQRRQLAMAPHPGCKFGLRSLRHVCKLVPLAACLVEWPVSLHYTRFASDDKPLAEQDPSPQKERSRSGKFHPLALCRAKPRRAAAAANQKALCCATVTCSHAIPLRAV